MRGFDIAVDCIDSHDIVEKSILKPYVDVKEKDDERCTVLIGSPHSNTISLAVHSAVLERFHAKATRRVNKLSLTYSRQLLAIFEGKRSSLEAQSQ